MIFWKIGVVLTRNWNCFSQNVPYALCTLHCAFANHQQLPRVCKQLFSRTFLRGFVSTLPLPTRFSSVPLLSLRTHPTSFPCSNSLVRYGWERDLAHAETESWHGLLPTPEKAGYHSLWTGISSSLFPAASSWNSTDVKGAPCLRIAEKWFRISDCCHP